LATLVMFAVIAFAGGAACNDVHVFEGTWQGPRVGDTPVLRVGVPATSTATLAIDAVDTHGMRGHLSISGLVANAPFVSVEGAEADALSDISFSGAPLRVYLAFVTIPDDGGEALAVIALFDHRVEVRILRGGGKPLYAIFALAEG
jgi:hypothetical protein